MLCHEYDWYRRNDRQKLALAYCNALLKETSGKNSRRSIVSANEKKVSVNA